MHLSPNTKSEAKRVALLLTIFVFLSGFYSFVTPLFEAPDENAHLQFIRWLAQGNPLPNIQTDQAKVSHEIGQPPLYYGLLAPLAARLDLTAIDSIAPINPYWRLGAGVNVHFHSEAEQFPYQGTALAVHLIRLFSVFLGSITVAATYALARILAPRLAFTAAMLVAFNPQFLFMSGVINNDNLVVALSGLTLLLLLKLMVNPDPAIWQYLLLGIVWGLAILAKLSGAGLGVVIVLGLGISAWRQRRWQLLLLGGSLVGAAMLLVSGWWFWRNWVLYGDPLAWNAFLLANANVLRPMPISWGEAIWASVFLTKSFWATFNYGVLAPDLFYGFINGLILVAVVGLVHWLWSGNLRRFQQAYLLFPLLAWFGLVYVALLRWMRLAVQTEQGRLMFPAIASLAVISAIGLHGFKRRWIPQTAVAILGMWAAILPVYSIQQAFATPPPLAEQLELPSPQNVLFGEEIGLLGYEVPPVVNVGELFVVHLFWESRQPMQESYVVALRLLDIEGEMIAGMDTLPYQNRYQTPNWPVQRPFQDTYALPIPETGVPGLAILSVSLYPWRQTERSLPVWVDGQQIGASVSLASVKIRGKVQIDQQPENNLLVNFGQQFQLFGYDVPSRITADQFEVALYWHALEPDGQDYTIFMHLIDNQGKLVAQADGPPQNGRYPTSILESGEQIVDTHLFTLPEDLPSGEYQILMGVYHPETGTRLPAINENNKRLSNDTVPLPKVIIIP
jgi:hypothetical protein